VSLFNVIEEIIVSAPPLGAQQTELVPAGVLPLPMFHLVTLWTRSIQEVPEEGQGRLRVLLPGDSSVPSTEFHIDLTQFLRSRVAMPLTSLPMRGEGTYTFVIESLTGPSEWTQMFELPLRVAFQRRDAG
jgi:hypothetical protein